MRLIALFSLLLLNSLISSPVQSLRDAYHRAIFDEAAASKFLIMTIDFNEKSDALFKGYKGAALILQSKHLIWPMEKWKAFNEGKEWLELGIKSEPNILELRYLRHAFQSNLPSVLDYRDNLKEDKLYLLKNTILSDDEDLRTRIKAHLLASEAVTKVEKEWIRKTWKK